MPGGKEHLHYSGRGPAEESITIRIANVEAAEDDFPHYHLREESYKDGTKKDKIVEQKLFDVIDFLSFNMADIRDKRLESW